MLQSGLNRDSVPQRSPWPVFWSVSDSALLKIGPVVGVSALGAEQL
jgi:hypothetical protein